MEHSHWRWKSMLLTCTGHRLYRGSESSREELTSLSKQHHSSCTSQDTLVYITLFSKQNPSRSAAATLPQHEGLHPSGCPRQATKETKGPQKATASAGSSLSGQESTLHMTPHFSPAQVPKISTQAGHSCHKEGFPMLLKIPLGPR